MFHFTEYLFDFDNIRYTWDDAKQFCEDIGTHLAIPATADDWEYMKKYVFFKYFNNIHSFCGINLTCLKCFSE